MFNQMYEAPEGSFVVVEIKSAKEIKEWGYRSVNIAGESVLTQKLHNSYYLIDNRGIPQDAIPGYYIDIIHSPEESREKFPEFFI